MSQVDASKINFLSFKYYKLPIRTSEHFEERKKFNER